MPAAASLKLQVFGWWVRAAGLLIRPKAQELQYMGAAAAALQVNGRRKGVR